jgi:hypothetical protein
MIKEGIERWECRLWKGDKEGAVLRQTGLFLFYNSTLCSSVPASFSPFLSNFPQKTNKWDRHWVQHFTATWSRKEKKKKKKKKKIF